MLFRNKIKVHGCAYSGGYLAPIKSLPVKYPLVIDLAGAIIPGRVPFMIDHELSTDSRLCLVCVYVKENKLVFSGDLVRPSRKAKHVIEQARSGHPWQASISGDVLMGAEVRLAGEYTINGRIFKAPFVYAPRWVLREISVCSIAVDFETLVTFS